MHTKINLSYKKKNVQGDSKLHGNTLRTEAMSKNKKKPSK